VSLASPYWGVQKLDSFPPDIIAIFDRGNRYVDLTAGGGGMVFERAKVQPVHGNDRNSYAAAAFTAAEELQGTRRTFDTLKWDLREGFLYHFRMDDPSQQRVPFPNVSDDIARVVDGLCEASDVAAYIAVRTLLDLFSVRCRAWDKVHEISQDDFLAKVRSTWTEFLQETAVCRKITGSNFDAGLCSEFVLSGDVVYSDPAWPWSPAFPNENADDNPYEFLTCSAGSILQQVLVMPETIPFWVASEPERVIGDVSEWVSEALEAGANYFVLSTQGTNWPQPELMYHAVSELVGVPVAVTYRIATTRRSNTPFSEWFGVFSA